MLLVGTLFFLIFTTTEIISELQDSLSDSDVYSPGLSRSYKYNHPPLFEPYLYIQDEPFVPEVEEIKVRKVREITEDSESSITLNPLQSELTSTQNILKETTYEEISGPEKIPVSIIYETEPNIERANNNGSNVKVRRRKRPKHSQTPNKEQASERNLAVKKKLAETDGVVTESNLHTSPTLRTIVPKTFTKRPPEDNPVTKKIRHRDPVVKIIEETNYVYSHSGTFHYSFEGDDGTKVSSQGELKTIADDKAGEAVVGSVFYKDNDGNDFSLSYTADENGYRPQGAHLPTPPPIPPAIARALKYLATATTPEPVTKRITSSV